MSSAVLTKRLSSSVVGGSKSPRKIVLIGAGFLGRSILFLRLIPGQANASRPGSYIARALIADPRNRVVLVSRHPQAAYDTLSHLGAQILPPQSADITLPATLGPVLEGASAVVSLVGLLTGSARQFDDIQRKGAENVALAAKEAGVGRVVMVSAIGADEKGTTPYQITKAQGEKAFLRADPTATIIRPSLVFGPGDSFFSVKWFSATAQCLLLILRPVYAGDVARAVEICCRDDRQVLDQVAGKIIEAGGPEVFTYREIMQLVLKYSGLQGRRLIISLPYWVGMIQGFFLEKLPPSMFTVTRDQIKQLRVDNIVQPIPPLASTSFSSLLAAFPSSLPSSSPPGAAGLTSVHKILPSYLGPKENRENGKRTHGRGSAVKGFEEVRNMGKK
ncbi:hypothetical protein P7C73_g1040, partial [Tremellales sp. Uapishka_1]